MGDREPHLRAACDFRLSQITASNASLPPKNPICTAAALGSGRWGIGRELGPGAPVQGSAYEAGAHDAAALPTTLWEAAGRLRTSAAARDLFGDAFVDHFAATREWEEREFRKHVSDWELARYFEII